MVLFVSFKLCLSFYHLDDDADDNNDDDETLLSFEWSIDDDILCACSAKNFCLYDLKYQKGYEYLHFG